MKATLWFVAIVSVLLVGCVPHQEGDHHEEHSAPIATDSPTIDSELKSITWLALAGTLKESDFATLETLVDSSDMEAIEEMKALARHKKFDHVQHALGMAQKQFTQEGELLCPAHELGHYYVFLEIKEDEIASHVLESVKESLPHWIELAEAYDSKNPGSIRYQESLDAVNKHLARIDSGNFDATPDEIEFLTGLGTICFSSDGEVEEHDHEGHMEGDEHSEEEHAASEEHTEEDEH